MTPSDRSEAIRRAQDGALKAANEGRWDHARAFLEYREEILKMDQSHLSAADSSAASGSDVPARPTLPGEGGPTDTQMLDWLEKCRETVYICTHTERRPSTMPGRHCDESLVFDGWAVFQDDEPKPSPRAAIYAAMKAREPQ